GITHAQIEDIGARLGKGLKDSVVIFALRAIPIMPTAPVSLVAGILKIDIKTYLVSSALGIFVRNMFYLYIGFTSLDALEKINTNLASLESIGSIIVLLFIVTLAYYMYKKRQNLWKESTPL
ncbi:MAG: VTT domain-containing protein, partial [Patescibacteria group bacterium]